MLRTLPDPHHLPALDAAYADHDVAALLGVDAAHPPRMLLLYGSLRERSFSRLLVEEAARLLIRFGCEVRLFDPATLPQADSPEAANHPAVEALRAHSLWSEGQVWCSPERHGAITAVLKNQIDHIPLSIGAVRPTQGRMRASPYYERLVDVMEELVKFTLLTRAQLPALTSRYSERREAGLKAATQATRIAAASGAAA